MSLMRSFWKVVWIFLEERNVEVLDRLITHLIELDRCGLMFVHSKIFKNFDTNRPTK